MKTLGFLESPTASTGVPNMMNQRSLCQFADKLKSTQPEQEEIHKLYNAQVKIVPKGCSMPSLKHKFLVISAACILFHWEEKHLKGDLLEEYYATLVEMYPKLQKYMTEAEEEAQVQKKEGVRKDNAMKLKRFIVACGLNEKIRVMFVDRNTGILLDACSLLESEEGEKYTEGGWQSYARKRRRNVMGVITGVQTIYRDSNHSRKRPVTEEVEVASQTMQPADDVTNNIQLSSMSPSNKKARRSPTTTPIIDRSPFEEKLNCSQEMEERKNVPICPYAMFSDDLSNQHSSTTEVTTVDDLFEIEEGIKFEFGEFSDSLLDSLNDFAADHC
jgi:hypothetical protein